MSNRVEIKKGLLGSYTISYDCPHCSSPLKSPLDDAGKSDSCPDCGKQFVVPGLAEREQIRRGEALVAKVHREEKELRLHDKELERQRQNEEAAQQIKAESELYVERLNRGEPARIKTARKFDFKNASPKERKKEYDRIAKEIGDIRFFTRKELNHLPKILSDGEQILGFSSGLMQGHTWLIALTDKRIIFLDKGLIFGLAQISIDLDKVNAIAGETGIIFGKISIEDGASSRMITMVPKSTVINFTNKARDAIEARKNALQPNQAPSLHRDDVVSKLEKLAVLVEKGLITRDEFAQQKANLLKS